MEDVCPDGWLREVVRLKPPAGQVRFLLRVQRRRCEFCASGTRTVSLWATHPRRGERVEWCGHCFNAECEPVALDAEQRHRYQALRAEATRGARLWPAVRPALEDLERRGVL